MKPLKIYSSKENVVYYCLAALRVILTILPQRGYIHPDEFFQSVEVIAGDIFDVEANRPWEFNSTFPIRSIFVPSIIVGFPYRLLKFADTFMQSYYNITLRTPYFLLLFPRLFVCALSFLIDYSLYKTCKVNNENFRDKLIILASSYVMLVYGTHTFSNTVEMVLVAVLLYLVAESQTFSRTIIKHDEFITYKYRRANTAIDRARLYKLRSSLPSHSMRNCIFISIITVAGVFNRPTFIAFAFPPVFFWVHRGIGFVSVRFSVFHYRMLLFVLCSTLFTTCFIIIDSFYFGYLSVAEIIELDISINSFVVTPLNFIKYNMDVNKLAEHGLHPRFLHLFVNIPLLFNVLGVIAITGMALLAYRLAKGRYAQLPTIHSIKGLMTAAFISPVAILSYFPHQEPRFLVPIILPLVYLFGHELITRKSLMKVWWILNALCVLFYGFVHQAGIYPLTTHLENHMQTSGYGKPLHLVTSHVYSLPVSLLLQRNTRKMYVSGSTKYVKQKTFILHEMGSESPTAVLRRLITIEQVKSRPETQVYLVLPITKELELKRVAEDVYPQFSLDTVQHFYPHISTEAFPNFIHPCTDEIDETCSFTFSSLFDITVNVLKTCGLGLYKVRYNNSVTYIKEKTFVYK